MKRENKMLVSGKGIYLFLLFLCNVCFVDAQVSQTISIDSLISYVTNESKIIEREIGVKRYDDAVQHCNNILMIYS